MTTETLVTSGQTDTATDSSQTATGTTTDTTAAPDAQQQQQAATDTTKTDDKSDEGAKDEGAKTDEAKAEEVKGAPEAYEDFAAPEGVALDADAVGEFKALAKELNLSQADAQRVVDLGPKMMATWQAKQAEQMSETVAQWATDTKADKEIGGDKLDENLAVARKTLDTFGSPELKTLLNESGLGNHPELIRLLTKAGKAISEDSFVGGKRATAAPSAKSFYDNSNMN